MFNIKIDRDLIAYLGYKKIRLDELFIVMCFGLNKIELLKTFLNERTGDQCTAFMQGAERKRLIRKISQVEEFNWDNYAITEEGNNMYEECLSNISERDLQALEVQILTSPCVQLSQEDTDLGQLVKDWLLLWPDGAKNTNGDRLKSNIIDVTKKMGQFIKKYKFDRETIMKSTEKYLTRQRAQGYAYCNQAMYFIMKDGISKLAAECENKDESPVNVWDNLA